MKAGELFEEYKKGFEWYKEVISKNGEELKGICLSIDIK